MDVNSIRLHLPRRSLSIVQLVTASELSVLQNGSSDSPLLGKWWTFTYLHTGHTLRANSQPDCLPQACSSATLKSTLYHLCVERTVLLIGGNNNYY